LRETWLELERRVIIIFDKEIKSSLVAGLEDTGGLELGSKELQSSSSESYPES
jgi:hypothetical protein